jgi:apurinic endonuclease APN1
VLGYLSFVFCRIRVSLKLFTKSISTKESFTKVLKDFDEIVGLKYLKAMHLNDSKGDLGNKLDRHENIGKGKIGIDAFKFIMNHKAFDDIPLILETPIGKNDDVSVWKKEIELLYSLVED